VRLADPLDDLLQSRSHVKVLRALVRLPKGIDASIREIARRAGITHPTASTVLEHLRAQGIVIARTTLLASEYHLNVDHVLAKRLEELFRFESGVKQDVLAFLSDGIRSRAPWAKEAYLFGSAAWGEMRPDSDLDVAVIGPPRKGPKLATIMQELGEDSLARFGNRVQAVIGTKPIEELAARGNRGYRLWREIAKDGIRFWPPDGEV